MAKHDTTAMAAKVLAVPDDAVGQLAAGSTGSQLTQAEVDWQHTRRHVNALLCSSLGVDRGLDAARSATDLDEE